MRVLILAALVAVGSDQWLTAQTRETRQVSASSSTTLPADTYVCPKCGRLHRRRETASTQVTVPATTGKSATQRQAVTGNSRIVVTKPPITEPNSRRSGSITNVLGVLNQQRARQGVASLRYDPVLQAVAERRARMMAASGQKNHPPGSFAPGTHEGVGWSSSYQPSGVSACYTSDATMRYAGAAMARGNDGVYFVVVYR